MTPSYWSIFMKTARLHNFTGFSTKSGKQWEMAEEFNTLFESASDCCGEHLTWEWEEDEGYFVADCICTKRYILVPRSAVVHTLDTHLNDDYIDGWSTMKNTQKILILGKLENELKLPVPYFSTSRLHQSVTTSEAIERRDLFQFLQNAWRRGIVERGWQTEDEDGSGTIMFTWKLLTPVAGDLNDL